MALSSPGIGSNLDVNAIVSQLMAVERQPLTALDKKEASYQAKLSAYGSIKGALATFQGAVRGLSNLTKFQAVKATPVDATLFSASATSIAAAGNYAVNTTQLAQAQTVMSAGQAGTTAAIGASVTTTLTFQFGTITGGTLSAGIYTGATFTQDAAQTTKTVTINATNNSLQGIRDAINAAGVGATATIVNDGSGGATPNHLVLTSNSTGATSSMKITVAGDATVQGLLAYDPAAVQNLSQTATAQNAALTVNGVTVNSASNTVSSAIPGVILNLLKAGSTTLSVARDTAGVQSAVQSFVDAYNGINKALSDMTAYNATTKQGAVLLGDATAQTIQNQLRGTLTSAVSGLSGSLTLLSQLGVSFQKDGSLALDATKLQNAINNNFNGIAGLFAATGTPSDSLIQYMSATANTKPGAYAVNITALATQGKSVGSAVAGLTINAGNNTFNVTVDGVSATVTLNAGTYTAASLATAMQSAINGTAAFSGVGSSVAVTQTAGVMTIASNRYGSASNASVSGAGATNLMGATPANTAGVDVAGTINGVAASGSGQYLTGAIGNASEGLQIQVTGGATGARGTVNYSQGYAYKLDKLVDGLLATTGAISSRTNGINKSIQDIGNQRDRFNRRLAGIEQRYRAQFTALDKMMGKMTTTSTFLTQQLANLPK